MRRPSAAVTLPGPLMWGSLWLVLVGVTLASRPLMPIDETRYLAVAWEMWQRGDFLVPYLNGEPYSHKPPLLFWLMQAGWAVLGVDEWWPRLVAPLFGLGCLVLTHRLGRRLWPDRPEVAGLAPLIVLGSLYWTLFSTLTFFDPILVFFTILGILGLVEMWRGPVWRGSLVVGLAIGLGVLAKGPAVLLHILPAALLAPLWAPRLDGGRPEWARWYLGVAGAVLLGAAVGLAWAIPAAAAGGPAYADAIFWGQSAGRMVESFDHGRPWWWYAAILPALLLPWPAWPAVWRAVARGRPALDEAGLRLGLTWLIVAFVAFSAISGKQPHYLLPEFPAVALIAARLLAGLDAAARPGPRGLWLPVAVFAVIGAVLAAAPIVLDGRVVAVSLLQPGWALLLFAAIGGAVWLGRRATLPAFVFALCLMSVAAIGAVHLAARPILAEAFDQAPLARQLGDWQRQGHPLAHFGKYHGQFNFLGRLSEPVAVLQSVDEAADWIARHPRGRIVSYSSERPGPGPAVALPFRGRWVEVWEAAVAAEDPTVLHRD